MMLLINIKAKTVFLFLQVNKDNGPGQKVKGIHLSKKAVGRPKIEIK